MIVCSCNVISDSELEAAFGAPDAPRTMVQIYQYLGHTPSCGRCAPTIRDIMREDAKGPLRHMAK